MSKIGAAVNRVHLSNPAALARVRELQRARRANRCAKKTGESADGTKEKGQDQPQQQQEEKKQTQQQQKQQQAVDIVDIVQKEQKDKQQAAVVKEDKQQPNQQQAVAVQEDEKQKQKQKGRAAVVQGGERKQEEQQQQAAPVTDATRVVTEKNRMIPAPAPVDANTLRVLSKRVEMSEKRLQSLVEENKDLRKELKGLQKRSTEIDSTQILFTRQFEKAVSLLLAHTVDRVSLERLSAVVEAKIGSTRRV